MSSLGEMLKREREARGISLEEISEQTKIGVRLLRAIENEQLDRLPGGIFNISFMRQYARYLGLEEQKAVREHLHALGGGREVPSLQKPAPPEAREPSASAGYFRVILTILGLAVLLGGAFYATRRFRESLFSSDSPATPVTPAAPEPEISYPSSETAEINATPTPPVEDSAVEASPGLPRGRLAPAPPAASATPPASTVAAPEPPDPAAVAATASGGVSVEIASRGTVWISIIVDGEKQWQGTMRPNQTRQVQAAGSVRLTVGDAGAVALLLNGKPLPPLGHSGEVKTVTITAKGLPEATP